MSKFTITFDADNENAAQIEHDVEAWVQIENCSNQQINSTRISNFELQTNKTQVKLSNEEIADIIGLIDFCESEGVTTDEHMNIIKKLISLKAIN